MGLGCRSERLLDSDVKLLGTNPEPAAAPASQGRRLLDLLQSKQVTEKTACLRFASLRSSTLHMIDIGDQDEIDYLKLPTIRNFVRLALSFTIRCSRVCEQEMP